MNKHDIKVLLINPFLSVYPDDPAGINPALGLGYLAAYLEEKNIKVSVLDIAAEGRENIRKIGQKIRIGLEEEEIIKRIKEVNPFFVGITSQSTLHAKDAHETAAIIKKTNKNILLVMGGAHPSAVPEEVLQDKNVDIVVRGEGEITLWNIVKNYSDGKSFIDVKGISFCQNKKIVHNPPRLLIKNLDELPFPARHLLPMNIYFKETIGGVNYNMHNRVVTMITSRGCPGNCIYCAVRTVWGRSWRGRSPRNVVDEMETLMSDYNIKEIHFVDDSIAVDRDRLEEICEEIILRKLNVRWTTPNGIAVWMLNEKLLTKMRRAGCYRLTFGLESGNREVLQNFIGKNYDYRKAQEVIKFASKIGMWTIGTFIVGFPYETREQIEDTITFAISTDLDFAVFYIANPFPGTPMYDLCLREGLLTSQEAYETVRGCRTKNFSHSQIVEIQEQALSRFIKSRLTKPYLLSRKLGSRESFSYLLKLSGKGLRMLNKPRLKEKGIAALWKQKVIN